MRIFFAHGGGEAFAPLAGGAGADRCRTGRPGPPSPRSTAATGTPGPRSCAVPQGPELAGYVEQHGAVVAFHAWLQWALELQFTAATDGMTVIQDLPIGVAGGGADAWAWQDVLAEGVSVGAPPDAFNSQGQDWGSPPLVPWRLRDADYEPFIQSIRATIAGAGGLRIDHVMGLFRLWWVPSDGSAADGAYVRYPAEDLLDIVALESHRAQALVVGEDLGTVEDGVREAMAEHGVLSYRLLWFEDDDPAEWPADGDGRHHHPRPADRRRAVDRRRTSRSSGSTAPAPRRSWSGAGRRCSRTCRGSPDDATAGRGGRAGAPAARPGAVDPAVGDPRRRRRRGAPAEHAGRRPTGRTGRCRCRSASRTCRGHPLRADGRRGPWPTGVAGD